MRTIRPIALLAATVALVVTACSSTPPTLDQAAADQVGAQLVNEYYDTLDCEGRDVERYGALLDPAFQSVTATGAKSKSEVLDVIGSVCFENPQVSDITVSAAPGVLVVSYRASIDRDGVAQTPTSRVNVFVDEGGTWKGVAFADAGLPAN